MIPTLGVVYDIRTLAPQRIIDPSTDWHPTLGMIAAANPKFESLIDGTHPLGPFEAMALIPKWEVKGFSLSEIAHKAILRKTGSAP